MKKLLASILILLTLLIASPSLPQVPDAIISSGYTTSDRLITSKPAYYYGCILLSSASTGTITVYDSTTVETGKEIYKASVGLIEITRLHSAANPIECFKGIYCDVTGTGAGFIIYYKIR